MMLAIRVGEARSSIGSLWPWLSRGSAVRARPGAALHEIETWIAARLRGRPGGLDRGVPQDWHWRDAILMHLLLREARDLIGAKLPTLPADVFTPAT